MASAKASLLTGVVDAASSAPILTGVPGGEVTGTTVFGGEILSGVAGAEISGTAFRSAEVFTGVAGAVLAFSVDPPPDRAPPVVGNFAPEPGSSVTRQTPIAFEVTDDSGAFRSLLVTAHYASSGVTELVHDGARFRGPYAASSLRTMIAGGFRYVILRSGGWPDAPTIETFAVDAAGNEVR